MIIYCVNDLFPFMMIFFTFLIVFSVCYVVLKMEIDPEVNDAQALSYFAKTFLQAYRTSLVELAMPTYEKISKRPDSTFKDLNILFIWIVWFTQTVFMIVIMLNFIVGVIQSTYEKVMTIQKIIKFKHRAELNYDCAVIISTYKKLEEYRIMILSTSKEATKLDDNPYDEAVVKI